jgi:hypothetical protein
MPKRWNHHFTAMMVDPLHEQDFFIRNGKGRAEFDFSTLLG